MTDDNSPVTEEELHAYIDGELPADRKHAVASWLAEHPEQAALVAGWRAQAEAIRARYGAVADEAVPARLKLDKIIRQDRAAGRSWIAMAATAATVAFVIGGSTGWVARGASIASPSGFDTITADAIEAHKLYVVEVRHPVEVPGNERAHMTAWLTKRVGYQQRIPNLESIGLKLVGGRLLPGPTGAAAAFYMYEGPSGERFTLYCSKSITPETALRFKEANRVAAIYWVDDNHAYVVSGPADRDRLEKISKIIYEQVEKNGAKKS
jgi:anti-sigma factor RsiW